MALDPLATTADLADRNICVPDGVYPEAILASATDAVREAAGCPITQATSTIVLVVDSYCQIDLPAGPVTSVASVVVGGDPVAGWVKLGDSIRMPSGWASCLPAEVTVTYTHGYPIVPADIVDLVCGMAGMAFAQNGEYGAGGLVASTRIGQWSETYARPVGADSPSPIALPDSVRQRLRARFGASVAAIGQR